jgi:hypothetical protein
MAHAFGRFARMQVRMEALGQEPMSTRHLLWRGVSSQPQDGVWIK